MARALREEGVWFEEKSHYWMVYKKFYFYDDVSGNEYIELQKDIRAAVADVRQQLAEHQIDVINVATHQFLDANRGGNTVGVAVAFKSREDLAMAKILIECDSVYGL